MLDREWQLDFHFRCFNISHVLIDTPKYVRDTNGRTSRINYLDREGGLEISRTVPEERSYFKLISALGNRSSWGRGYQRGCVLI
jgi:hypothetical protein